MADIDWKQFRPRGDWLIVKCDPRVKVTKGGIILTEAITGVERVMEGSGVVLRVGSTVRKCLGVALEPGTRIVYRGFLKDATFQEFTPDTHPDGSLAPVFLLHAKDVIAELDSDAAIGAFS